jgi:hypothetical protein
MSSDCTSRDVLEHATGRGDSLTRPGRRTLAVRRSPRAVGGVSEPDARADPSSPGGGWAREPGHRIPRSRHAWATTSRLGRGSRRKDPVRCHAVEGVFRPHPRSRRLSASSSSGRASLADDVSGLASAAPPVAVDPSRKPTRLRTLKCGKEWASRVRAGCVSRERSGGRRLRRLAQEESSKPDPKGGDESQWKLQEFLVHNSQRAAQQHRRQQDRSDPPGESISGATSAVKQKETGDHREDGDGNRWPPQVPSNLGRSSYCRCDCADAPKGHNSRPAVGADAIRDQAQAGDGNRKEERGDFEQQKGLSPPRENPCALD